jgi:tRNA nucleotidyltransferase (CCA-adding enzyme)
MTAPATSPTRLRRDLLDRLAPAVRDAVGRIVAAASPRGGVYAVGGTARDLLLDREFVDVDIAVESDAPTAVGSALPGVKATVHARFRTASITVAGTRIDVATTRSETYARPGALPRVVPSDIDTDLRRRDFSMNAVALRLSGDPAIIDPMGGVDDTGARTVRVLHDASFHDDATRIFRAFRYAARLNFLLDTHTEALLAQSVSYIDAIGGERLRREIELILSESCGGVALEAAHTAGALGRIHPALTWEEARSSALANPGPAGVPLLPYGFALLLSGASQDDARLTAARLKLKRDEAAAVDGIAAMRDIARTLRRPEAKPSGVVLLLDRFPVAAVAARAAVEPDPIARVLAVRYLEEWRSVKPILHGDELIEMGVPAGPQVQRGLQLLRAARLDGWASDRDDERALILRFAKSIRDSQSANSPIELTNLN